MSYLFYKKNEQSESTDLIQGEPKLNLVLMRSRDLDSEFGVEILKFSRNPLVQRLICVKSRQFFQRRETNCGKNATSRDVEESFEKFSYPDPDKDDFQNVTGSFFSRDKSLVKFSSRSDQ